MTLLYITILLLFASVSAELSATPNSTNQTTPSTTLFVNTTTSVSAPTTTSTIASSETPLSDTPAVDRSTTTDVNSIQPFKPSSRSKWWLGSALLITAVVIVLIGVIYYHRRYTPYRRFLRNWRSREDDADNIILQLEQPEIISGHWPPRISFA